MPHLILSRHENEKIRLRIGDKIIWLEVCKIERGRVRIGIHADSSVEVMREELLPESEWHGKEVA